MDGYSPSREGLDEIWEVLEESAHAAAWRNPSGGHPMRPELMRFEQDTTRTGRKMSR